MLADLVKSGKLPAVELRLPANPLILKPVEKVGKYGGTWRSALQGGADDAWLTRTIGYDYLVRWDLGWTTVIPCVAESWSTNADSTEYTFKLRKGMKWSDAEPFTADDIVFWMNDVLNNKELTPATGGPWAAGGKYGTAVKADETTVTWKFAAANGLVLVRNATPDGQSPVQFQAKYCKQFHKAYADPVKLDALIKENKQDDWIKLFGMKCSSVAGTPIGGRWQNPQLPVLSAWVLTTPSSTKDPCRATRNPYYWKVDTEGNQLPYIDNLFYDFVTDLQALVLKAANGEVDYMDRFLNTATNKPVYVNNAKKADISLYEETAEQMNPMVCAFNLTHKDKQMRAIFQDLNFRAGMSHAINRQEMIDVLWIGQGEPWQAAPRPTSPYYSEKMAKQYTEYDVKKANEYLDKVLPKKDAAGMRLMPDGKPLAFALELANIFKEWTEAGPMLQKYWKAVGVDVTAKVLDRTLVYAHKDANEFDAMCWTGPGGLDVILDPRWYFPFSTESQFGMLWQYWYNKDVRGEEPPAAPKKQMELYSQLKATGDTKKQTELMKEILQIAQEQFYAFGIVLSSSGYSIVKNNFKNVPKVMPASWNYPTPGPADPPQFYFDS